MFRRRHKSRFESEVHLGLLAITLLLLFLNVASNYILYQARTTEQEETQNLLRQAAVSLSRRVQLAYPGTLSENDLVQARTEYGLSGLVIAPSRPGDESEESRRVWLRDVVKQLPPDHLPMIADALFGVGFHQLARGSGDQYYYLYPIPSGAGHNLMILTADRPDLAYLDDSRSTLFIVQVALLGFVAIVYVLLSRFIFTPFRRIRKSAEEAGRRVDSSENESEAIVREYEAIIVQLKDNEAELLRLNEAIRDRADSLEEFNRLLLESGQAGILTVNAAGIVAGINDRAREMLVLADRQLSGCSVEECLESLPEIGEAVRQALDTGRIAAYREYGDLFGGDSDTVLGISMTGIGSGEDREGLLVFINDVTEIARLRRELEDKKRLVALGEMAGGLAHQIRNSLGAISGYAVLCKKQLKSAELSQDRVENLLAETKEAETLIGRFLTFARPFDYTPASTRLDILVRETVSLFEVQLEGSSIEIDVEAPLAVTIRADQVLLKQVLVNLITNAIQAYDGQPGRVNVTVSSGKELVSVAVSDNASGIPPDELERIFTPFFSSRPSGTGLGLPLARRIVDLHLGRLTVESKLGAGSTFRIQLPVWQAENKGAPTSRVADPA